MLKSERGKKRETTETNAAARTLQPVNNRWSGLACLQSGRNGGGAFISQRTPLEWSFCTVERKRKENDSQVLAESACVWMDYASELFW